MKTQKIVYAAILTAAAAIPVVLRLIQPRLPRLSQLAIKPIPV